MAKTIGACAADSSPIDSVTVAGFVRVLKNLLSGLNFTLIDLISHYESVRAAEGN
jgi:hypothetical protein